MFFRQVLYRDLGCASYVFGDDGEAVVVDPRWDIDVYLEIAREQRLRIVGVIDTHDHADHVSGRTRLAQVTGAWARRPAGAPGAAGEGTAAGEEIAAGDRVSIGSLWIEAIAAPGHRPEHLALAVGDVARGEGPWMVLTGDSLLVGDVARPDLAVEARDGAAELHASLRRLLSLGDHVELWPGHVGGSLCGGAHLSGKTSSTLGYERRCNPLLTLDQPEFVDAVTSSVPTRPPNVQRIVGLNRRGGGDAPAAAPMLEVGGMIGALRRGVIVLDCRAPEAFDEAHVAGTINLPVSSPGVGTRAGWTLDPLEPVVVVAADEAAGRRMETALQAVGFWAVSGIALADPRAWNGHGLPVARADSWDLAQLADSLRTDAVELIDVREPEEWRDGHVAGSRHLPLHRLRDVPAAADPPAMARPTAVACAGGIRAAFAASVLRRAGRQGVVRVAGGGIGDLAGFGIGLQRGM